MLMQTKWASQLNPVLANPATNASILKNVPLIAGINVINHLLGETLQGWIVTDINATCTIFRSAPKNDLTLTLTVSAPAIADILVF